MKPPHVCIATSLKSFKGSSSAFQHTLVNRVAEISFFHGFQCDIKSLKGPNVSVKLVISTLQGRDKVKTRETELMRKATGCGIFNSVKTCLVHCLGRGLPRGRGQRCCYSIHELTDQTAYFPCLTLRPIYEKGRNTVDLRKLRKPDYSISSQESRLENSEHPLSCP